MVNEFFEKIKEVRDTHSAKLRYIDNYLANNTSGKGAEKVLAELIGHYSMESSILKRFLNQKRMEGIDLVDEVMNHIDLPREFKKYIR